MSENYEPRFVGIEKEIEFLKGQAVQREHVRALLKPVEDKQDAHDRRLDKLTDLVERQAKTVEKQSEKIESILDDFHKSLLSAAEARQFLNVLKTSLPLIVTGIIIITSIFGACVWIYRVTQPVAPHGITKTYETHSDNRRP